MTGLVWELAVTWLVLMLVLSTLWAGWQCRREIADEVRYRLAWWRHDRELARRERARAGVARDITRVAHCAWPENRRDTWS